MSSNSISIPTSQWLHKGVTKTSQWLWDFPENERVILCACRHGTVGAIKTTYVYLFKCSLTTFDCQRVERKCPMRLKYRARWGSSHRSCRQI